MREAPSRVLIEELLAGGATVSAYDPVAMPAARSALASLKGVRYADSPLAALKDADALVVVTEWQEFRSPDFERLRELLKAPIIFDGRNLYDPAMVSRFGITYYAIGRGKVLSAA
jgi:UDPglucose 6-dehydrogenase